MYSESGVDPTLTWIVPSCLLIPLVLADTNVCGEVLEDVPTLTLKLFVVTSEIVNHSSPAGSFNLGYE